MQKSFDKPVGNGDRFKRFSQFIQSVPQGGFLCSAEHGKLCFEALETEFVPQNNLPCWELEKRLPKSAFCMD